VWLLPLAFVDAATPLWMVAALLVAEGVGQGLLAVAYIDLVTDTLPARDRGVAGSLAQLTRTLGIVSGASVLTALHAHAASGGFLAGYKFAFLVAGGGLLVALAVSCLWPRAWFAR
jgi:sugar phosphate permease